MMFRFNLMNYFTHHSTKKFDC